MRRLLVVLVTAVMSVLLVGPAQAGTALAPQAVAFRADAIAQLHRYEAVVAPRLNTAERAHVHGLITDAERQLSRLTVATKRLDSARSSQKASRKATALAAYTSARASADAAIAEIQPLAVRSLGFGELLQAKQDADAMLARFDRLGAAIRAA